MAKIPCLRTCDKDGRGYGGFQWPKSGTVSAPDWNPRACCGFGLHGLLRGEGNGELLNWADDSVWIVFLAEESEIVAIDGGEKVKCPTAEVVFYGDRMGAISKLMELGCNGSMVGAVISVGDKKSATAGYRGTATAGYRGTATAGDRGTATAGDRGTATAGDEGTATAGYRGTATAGYEGILTVRWWDGNRYRLSVGYVGENGIEPNKKYKLDDTGKFIPA